MLVPFQIIKNTKKLFPDGILIRPRWKISDPGFHIGKENPDRENMSVLKWTLYFLTNYKTVI
jgi:hypothetical protein